MTKFLLGLFVGAVAFWYGQVLDAVLPKEQVKNEVLESESMRDTCNYVVAYSHSEAVGSWLVTAPCKLTDVVFNSVQDYLKEQDYFKNRENLILMSLTKIEVEK